MTRTTATVRSDITHYAPDQFTSLDMCPHCGTQRPALSLSYHAKDGRYSHTMERKVYWGVYACSSCGLPVVLQHLQRTYLGDDRYRHDYIVFPDEWAPDGAIPEQPRKYLEQANATIAAPDASVIMSASAIDAMLKDRGLSDGSLYSRIDAAVEQGLLTSGMSEWAHLVRLDSNNPRHADESTPHMTVKDAKLSLDFAKALAEVLFVLPSKMPTTVSEPG